MAFPTTHWSLLADATLAGDTMGRRALDEMCAAYRQPVIAFLASRGYREQEQEDLAQEFFLVWLRSRSWKRADRARGKFRTFLLGSLVHMLEHQHEKRNAARRGSGAAPLSLEALPEDGCLADDGSPAVSEEFDRQWAAALVENTLAAVADEFSMRGRAEAFAVLRRFLPSGGDALTLEEAAQLMDTNVGAVKAAVHRLRERFRQLLREAVAATVAAPHEVDEELIYLRSLLLMPASRIPEPENRKIP